MELRDFVDQTLRQIIEGVVSATPRAEELGAFINPADVLVVIGGKPYGPTVQVPGKGPHRRFVQMVDFDLAVVVTRGESTKAGAGVLTVVALGGSHEAGAKQETTSRVKFSVPITLPLYTGGPPSGRKGQTPGAPPAPPAQPGPQPLPAPEPP